jgi:hypothetical protein
VTRRYNEEVNAIRDRAGIFDDLWDMNFKIRNVVLLVLVRLLCRLKRNSIKKWIGFRVKGVRDGFGIEFLIAYACELGAICTRTLPQRFKNKPTWYI